MLLAKHYRTAYGCLLIAFCSAACGPCTSAPPVLVTRAAVCERWSTDLTTICQTVGENDETCEHVPSRVHCAAWTCTDGFGLGGAVKGDPVCFKWEPQESTLGC